MKWKEHVGGIIVGVVLGIGGTFFTLYQMIADHKVNINSLSNQYLDFDSRLKRIEKYDLSVIDRIKNVDEKLFERHKPSYLSEDEWNLDEGLRSYSMGDYDVALIHFSKINSLKMPDFIKWKYYESLAKFRILQYQKYRKLIPLDQKAVSEVTFTLKKLKDDYPNNKFSEDITYWYAQTLYHFQAEYKNSFNIFKTLKDKYPWGRWKEGTLYYLSMCLLKSGNSKDRILAARTLEELLAKFPNGLIQIIEENDDFRIDGFVPRKIREIKTKYDQN